MALRIWPADLPQKVRVDGFERARPDLIKASRMASGVRLTRPIALSGEETLSCQIRVDRGGEARFDRFFSEETSRGAKPFIIRDQIYDGVDLVEGSGDALLSPAGEPLLIASWLLVRFTPGNPPRDSGFSGLFARILFSLDVMP